MYQPRLLAEGLPPYAVGLVEFARSGRLVIYVGAGLSRAEPTGLPSGADIAHTTYQQLSALFNEMPDCDEHDLTSVANAVAGLPGAMDALRETVVGAAEFTAATPNYGHKILAMLLLEGLVTVLTTNWDDCIERGGHWERVLVIITADERRQVAAKALLKLHGCATRPVTLLLTSAELNEPPDWVLAEANARLTNSYVVFVGIGDVAGYMRRSIARAVETVGTENVRVVFPSAADRWEASTWSGILPDLAAEQRIGHAADDFLDSLACGYILLVLREVGEAYADNAAHAAALQRVIQVLRQKTALDLLRWFRSAAVPPRPGEPVLTTGEAARAIVALGVLDDQPPTFEADGRAIVAGAPYVVLIAAGLQPASRLRREAQNRLEEFFALGGARNSEPTFLVSSAVPILTHADNLPHDVVGLAGEDDLLDGPLNAIPTILDAMEVLAS